MSASTVIAGFLIAMFVCWGWLLSEGRLTSKDGHHEATVQAAGGILFL